MGGAAEDWKGEEERGPGIHFTDSSLDKSGSRGVFDSLPPTANVKGPFQWLQPSPDSNGPILPRCASRPKAGHRFPCS